VHIIAELLEAIIEENTMGLKIAELEGDAVFFYRVGEKPTQEELFDQVKKMYIAFHKQLKLYERDRICSCGACSTANALNIKFVSHYGDVVERTIRGHFQLMGADVTLAHKFLKNDIDGDEYILLSDNTLAINADDHIPEWIKIEGKNQNYDGVGEVSYIFSKLDVLKSSLPPLEEKRKIEKIENPIELSLVIDSTIENVYSALTNNDLKKEWVNGLKEVIQDEERVQRIGSSHECLLPIGAIHIETVDNVRSKDEIVYTEFTDSSLLFPAFYQQNTLKKIDENTTELMIEIHYKGSPVKEAILRLGMKSVLTKSLNKFKEFCENNEVESDLVIQ